MPRPAKNMIAIRNELARGPMTWRQICEATGLSDGVVYSALMGMKKNGQVVGSDGRPCVFWLSDGAAAESRATEQPAAAAKPADQDDDAAQHASDLQRSRAWLKNWRPVRDHTVAALFGPQGMATGNNVTSA